MDYQKLNRITIKDKYLSLLIKETFRRIIKAKVFTKLDIWNVFYCIRMHPDLKELIAFGICYRAYQYRVTLFELCNWPVTFERFINFTLKGLLNKTCIVYVNNILVYLENPRYY